MEIESKDVFWFFFFPHGLHMRNLEGRKFILCDFFPKDNHCPS